MYQISVSDFTLMKLFNSTFVRCNVVKRMLRADFEGITMICDVLHPSFFLKNNDIFFPYRQLADKK